MKAPFYKSKGERNEYTNYMGTYLLILNVDGKMYTEVLMNRVHGVSKRLTDHEQQRFKPGKGGVT